MLIKTLVENTSISEGIRSQHGLSLYIETKKHKILFDLGEDNLFLENASKMEVDISTVDTVIISHGHYDHGGGLEAFLKTNDKARIYIHEAAFNDYFSKRSNSGMEYIGLNKELKESRQIIFTKDYLRIDEELELFSNCHGKELNSSANKPLFMKIGEEITGDTFVHEQNLIINEGDKTLLIAGCAHNGIVNILNKYNSINNEAIDFVFGGFHLFNYSINKSVDSELVKKIGEFLLKTDAVYYTCHCTGMEAFISLKEIMHDKVQYLYSGNIVEI
jgi:7,8-dihydropterin-6-yl-methyl-4-(beta-D-ribofuranosyl)aminobenzene 5'-phosphate synthase